MKRLATLTILAALALSQAGCQTGGASAGELLFACVHHRGTWHATNYEDAFPDYEDDVFWTDYGHTVHCKDGTIQRVP